jgi:hypothetical protein
LKAWLGPKEGSALNAITIEDDIVPIRQEPIEEGIDMSDIPEADVEETDIDAQNDDKKLVPRTNYEGFSIYGQYMCLFVKKIGGQSHATAAKAASSQQMMENWISTQVAAQADLEDDAD